MALQKDKTLPDGSNGNYWTIGFDASEKLGVSQFKGNTKIFLWKDQAMAQTEGAQPLSGASYSFKSDKTSATIDDVAPLGTDTVWQATQKFYYTKLKEMAQAEALKPVNEQDPDLVFFADAVDV